MARVLIFVVIYILYMLIVWLVALAVAKPTEEDFSSPPIDFYPPSLEP